MSNWQQNFNLDAPEFVPKCKYLKNLKICLLTFFIVNIQNNAQAKQQMEPQISSLLFQQGLPIQSNRQSYEPQNQFSNIPSQQLNQRATNLQNQPKSTQTTDSNSASFPNEIPASNSVTTEKSIDTLSSNIERLSTKLVEEKINEQKQESSIENDKINFQPVSVIKEDEGWDKEADEESNAENNEGATEATKPSKKQLIVREYKPKKEPINVIFCGHVDAGKSTIGGQIMFLNGMVDKRTLEKYEREAKEKNRESWYLSWALDTNLEEREKGKTVEVGRAFFETEKKHFIILDAPGHKGFVPNMIGGASQADIAVLVISARKGEFETGFERGGQTREHAMLVKTAGVKYLIVLVNKMDDSTVNWDKSRYEEIKEKLSPYLKKCGFQPGKDTTFMPCSGYTGAFIKEPASKSTCSWYSGPCFIDYLDSLPTINRTVNGPIRMPLIDKYKVL